MLPLIRKRGNDCLLLYTRETKSKEHSPAYSDGGQAYTDRRWTGKADPLCLGVRGQNCCRLTGLMEYVRVNPQ